MHCVQTAFLSAILLPSSLLALASKSIYPSPERKLAEIAGQLSYPIGANTARAGAPWLPAIFNGKQNR
jgi:hypothetical protein